ncbi:MAG TPA: hypothetical protein VML01_04710 [Bryobacterales bacterium]|nr:hypothetical protein [Bryobacterales bacterium]
MTRIVLVACVGLTVLASAVAQEEQQEYEYIDPQSPSWSFGDPEERRAAHYQELQDEWSQLGQLQPEEEPARPRPQRSRKPEVVSLSLLTAPKAAKKAYQRALAELKKNKSNLDKAASDLSRAVQEYPEMAPAWELLGWVSTWRGNRPEAQAMFLQSVEADSRYQNGYVALARAAVEEGQWQQATEWSERAVKIDPSTSRPHFYWAIASFYSNDLDTASREAQRALATPDPFLPAHTHQILGAVHHRRGDLQAAAEHYRMFLKAEPNHPLSARLAKEVADWEAAGAVPAAAGRKPRS